MRCVIRGTACDRRRHRGWPARPLFFVFFLIAPLPDWKPQQLQLLVTTRHRRNMMARQATRGYSNVRSTTALHEDCRSRGVRSEETTSELQYTMSTSFAVPSLTKKKID